MAFTPPDLAGLFAWHRPESLAGNADGAEVRRWPDEGPHGYHLADEPDPAETVPRYMTSAINGRPGLRWPAATLGHLRYPTYGHNEQPVAYTAMTLFMVTLPRGANSRTDVHAESWGDNNGGHPGVGFSDLAVYRLDSDSTQGPNNVFVRAHDPATLGTPGITIDQPIAHRNAGVTTVVRGTGLRAQFDCDTLATATASLGTGWVTEWYVIGQPDAIISEIVAYTRALSDAEIKQVRCYLSDKYGLALGCCNLIPLRRRQRDDALTHGTPRRARYRSSHQQSVRRRGGYV